MKLTFVCDRCGKTSSSEEEPLHDWVSLTVRRPSEAKRFYDFCSLECLRGHYTDAEKPAPCIEPVAERWWPGLLSLSLWVLLLILALVSVRLCEGAEVKLRWNPNPEPYIAGYELSVGTSPGLYSRTVKVGTVTTYTLSGLDGGRLYYFGLVAVSTEGVKSATAEINHVTKADVPPLDRVGWVVTASSAETVREDNKAANAIDGDPQTLWHTTWGVTLPPHFLRIDLPRAATISGLRYLPRQDDGVNGMVTSYQVEISDDGIQWSEAATGTWPINPTEKFADLGLRRARHLRLWGQDSRMSAAEIYLVGTYEPAAPVTFTLTYEQSVDQAKWENMLAVPPVVVPKEGLKKFFRLKIEPTPTP